MVRKLEMSGTLRDSKVSSYYSWPTGTHQLEVEKLIAAFKNSFPGSCSIVITHFFEDL